MDAKKTYREKARFELHRNITSYLEQILEATPHETATVELFTFHLKSHQRRTRHVGHCWRSKDKLISDILLWTPTHGYASVGQPIRTYLHQLCADTGCNLENLPGVINDREG